MPIQLKKGAVGIIPNALILDQNLHYTAKKVFVVLQLLARRKNREVRVSFKDLARLAHVSTGTAQKAVEKLEGKYLSITDYSHPSEEKKCMVHDANGYTLICQEGGYTLIHKEILDYKLTPAAFAVLLYLYYRAGRNGRAWPSLRCIAKDLKMAKSTVCKALTLLWKKAQAIVRLKCQNKNKRGFMHSNSYYPTDCVICGKRNDQTESRKGFSVCGEGGPIFDKPNINKQITEGHNWSREEKRPDSSTFFLDFGRKIWCERYFFDGIGVKVCPGEEDYAITV